MEQRSSELNIMNMNILYFCVYQGPGIFFIVPCVDSYQCVDLRTVSFDVPPQEVSSGCGWIIAKDNNICDARF